MKFSTTEHKHVIPAQSSTTPAHEYTTVTLKGPCFICEAEMEYTGRWPYSEEHARNQFKPKRWARIIDHLQGGTGLDVPQIGTLENMVCPKCREECRKMREKAARQARMEQLADQQKVEQNRLARERHYAWRTVTASEVDPTPHAAEFRAVFSNFEVHEIVFRWRAVPGKCRGESFLMKVGMWVDKKLTAHYHGWNLQYLFLNDGHRFFASEDEWATSDLFGLGFCRWIERAFQSNLLRLKPNQSWRVGQFEELDTRVGSRPAIVRLEWLDGSRYVHVLPSLNLPEVAEWADENLELRIEELAFRSVRRAAAATAGSDDEEE